MRTLIFGFLLLLFCNSCFPTKIAPRIEDYKLTTGKKFKKQLPKRGAFIFEDPKNANEFYKFINAKFKLNDTDVRWNVPFKIAEKEFYFSFYEVERTSKTINIAPMIIDAALDPDDTDPGLEDLYTSRSGTWYIALTVNDEEFMDPLKENYPQKEEVIAYLRNLKKEYLSTRNYKKYSIMN
ncbi:hypothetical protein [Aquimarina litoralis]|uniref:hypothetical protein n=1 Tax=Aquimarina litoralis TaxID=584605 RepID=UPI001C55971E|nr:hypothetical protein [Aquimarina litoralis]MBW1295147.1 hypothetical protein [Aquimarina litoralis]